MAGSHLDGLGHDAQRVRTMLRQDSFYPCGKEVLSLLAHLNDMIPT